MTTKHSVLWYGTKDNTKAGRVPCESLQEAKGVAQHIEAKGPYCARIETIHDNG